MRPYFRYFFRHFSARKSAISTLWNNIHDSTTLILAVDSILWICCLIFLNIPPWGSRFTVNVQFNSTQNLVRKTFHSEEAKKTKVENCPFGVLLLEYVISINVLTVDSLFVAIFTAQTLNQSQQWKSKFLHLLSKAVCYYFEYMLSKRPEATYSVYTL